MGDVRLDLSFARAELVLRRLTPSERWCYIAGILPIAAESPQKGRLLIATGLPADGRDYAESAGVRPGVVRSTLAKLRGLGAIRWDEDEGCEYIAHTGFWDRVPGNEHRWARDRYARWASAPGCVTDRQLADRVAFYGGVCWICRTATYETLDHVKPLARGGSNWPANLRPACRSCNSRKGARWPFDRSMLVSA